MVKKIIIIVTFLNSYILADFNSDCLKCHVEKRVSLRKAFMNALLVYGGKNNFKTGLFFYCKNPNPESSVMNDEFVKKFIPLVPIKISDKKLHFLLDYYWEKYKIKGKLK